MSTFRIALIGVVTLLTFTCGSSADERSAKPARPGAGGGGGKDAPAFFHTDVPVHPGSVVLARPTDTSVTASVLVHADGELRLVWGGTATTFGHGAKTFAAKASEPVALVLGGLSPDTRYFYEVRSATTGARLLPANGPGTFHTARPRGAAFTFTITADTHLDARTSPPVYLRALAAMLADHPDFHVDLGDTFMTEKHPDRTSAAKQYLAQRFFFGQLAHSAPLFLALGNHDGESPSSPHPGAESLAVWSNQMRKRFFPNPTPGYFYTGNATPHPAAGPLEDYYAWEWGDALFVVLDPFWFSRSPRGRDDNWGRSLGEDQYRWLERTLANSHACFKFIFLHHLVGGADPQGRGGSEAAPYYEWGGRDADGSDGFAAHRSGWTEPIHALLVRHGVTAVFHGHDHLFAEQELDGILYQEVPQPGYLGRSGVPRSAAEYGYRAGTILGSPGYLRVKVAADATVIELVRPAEDGPELAHQRTIRAAAR